MRVAYVDTSCLVALAFGEEGSGELSGLLGAYDALVSANLTDAEFRAAFQREGIDGADDYLTRVAWLMPDRPLTLEIEMVLRARYLRGADLWHVACALYLAEEPGQVDFLTLDADQRDAARELRFTTPV